MPKLLHTPPATNSAPREQSGTDRLEFKAGIFFFAQESLRELKTVTNRSLSVSDPGRWVSTNDILTALLWCAVIKAETSESDAHGFTTIGFPVNFRSRLDPPLCSDFLGSAFMMTTAKALLDDLLSSSIEDEGAGDGTLPADATARLARIALTIHNAVNAVDGAQVRAVLEYLRAQTDVQSVVLGPPHDGISIVSWADQGAYELDWGAAVGRCEAVRLPRPARRRYPIILPRIPDSLDGRAGLEVFVSLEQTAFGRFVRSWPISRWAEPRCGS